MRIRKRFPPPSFTSDLPLGPSAAAPPQSDPPQRPSHKIMGISNINTPWGWPDHPEIYNIEEKMELIKEFGDVKTWREEEKKSGSNDVRTISYEQERTNITIMHPSSSSADHQVGWCEGDDYKLAVPLKKRKGSFERNSTEETSSKMKSKTYRVEIHINEVDRKICQDCNSTGGGAKKSKRRKVIMEGSRCSRVNGRGWRCCQPTLVGYALCEHHLGKGRLRSMGSVGCREVGGHHQQLMMIGTKKRRKKARSISSLLSQV